jgi:uncharacterized protein
MIFINITEECNLSCKHCYVSQSAGEIQIDVYEKFLDYLINYDLIAKDEKINLIGGEPLLYPQKVKQIIDITKKRIPKAQIIISTNLSLEYLKIKEILEDPLVQISTSLDGTKYSHNRIRKMIKGDSFELVTNNLKKLTKLKNQIRVVYTFDPNFIIKNFIEFVEVLLTINPNPKKWRINIRPATPYQNFDNCNWYIDEIKKLTNYWIDKYKNGILINLNFIASCLNIIKMKKERGPPCELGESSFRLTPNGDIWPCTQYFALKKRKIGNIINNNFKELEYSRKKLILFKFLTYEKFYEKECDCFFESNCNKIHCLANFEQNNFKCTESRKVIAKMSEEIVNILKRKLSKKDISSISLEEDYED